MLPRPPVTDLFGTRGRAWLARQALPGDERETVTALLRQLDFYGAELSAVERRLAAEALDDPVVRRLMTVPGVDAMTAVTVLAAVRRASAGPLCESTSGTVWKSVRAKALRGKATTTLARRLYDLRHTGISPVVYAKCIDGKSAAQNKEIDDAPAEDDEERGAAETDRAQSFCMLTQEPGRWCARQQS